MSWFDDLLNTQWFKDGVALPRRQIVDVTFPAPAGVPDGGGTITDLGAVSDSHSLRLPRYRPYWYWPLTAAPAVAALRYIRPFRDIYDTAFISGQAWVVPKKFAPEFLHWQCYGSALSDAITFTVYKNGVATATTLTVPGGTGSGTYVAAANGVTFDTGDLLGLTCTQAGTAAQAAWKAVVGLSS